MLLRRGNGPRQVRVSLPMKEQTEFLETFARNFVRPAFATRFLLEAVNKPNKLQSGVCHEIDRIFPQIYRNGKCAFSGNNRLSYIPPFLAKRRRGMALENRRHDSPPRAAA